MTKKLYLLTLFMLFTLAPSYDASAQTGGTGQIAHGTLAQRPATCKVSRGEVYYVTDDPGDGHGPGSTECGPLDNQWRRVGAGSGVTAHSALTGLSADDHPQYFNQARGDARYSLVGHTHAESEVTGLVSDLAGKASSSALTAEASTRASADTTLQSNIDAEASARAAAITSASTADRARANHTGTQSADTLTDGTTNKAFLATERTKLAGVATGATANSPDATLLARANHTGTQLASTISDFNSAAQSAAPAETVTTTGTLISGATSKTTPVDADSIGLSDSAASNVLKKLTFANLKATFKTYFDTLYNPLLGYTPPSLTASSGVIPKSNGTNLVASRITDGGTDIAIDSGAGKTTIGDAGGTNGGTSVVVDDAAAGVTVSAGGGSMTFNTDGLTSSAVTASNYYPFLPGVNVLGGEGLPFASLYLGNASGNTARLTGTFTTNRTITIADADGTLATTADLAGKQASDAELTALAGLTSAADKLPYFTGSGTAGTTTFTAFGRSLVDDADAATARTTLGLNNVTNDAQTKAAIVPNTAPSSAQLLVGNAGGTAYAPQSVSGDVTITSGGVTGIGAGKVTNTMLAGSIDLTTKATGALPVANGGTGGTDAATARANLAAVGSLCVYGSGAGSGNVSTGETDLGTTCTLAANTLSANNKGVEIFASGTFANNGNSKTVKLYFGATSLVARISAVTNTGTWWIQATVIRTGTATQVTSAFSGVTNGASITQNGIELTTPGETMSGSVVTKVTGQSGTASNDVLLKIFTVKMLP
jgi:hypothetical protein